MLRVSTDEIAKLIFTANHFVNSEPSPLGFRMFSFERKVPKYTKVEAILDKINPSLYGKEKYAQGYSGLAMAVQIGSLDSVKYFLDNKKIDPDKILIFPDEYTKMMSMFSKNLEEEQTRHTVLMLAIERGHPDIVKMLLEHGAEPDPKIETSVGSIPLVWAVIQGSIDSIKLLMKYNADLERTTGSKKETALMIAVLHNRIPVVEFLSDHVNLDKVNTDNKTALMLAVEKGNFEAVEVLLKKPNTSCDSALILAVNKKHLKIIDALLVNGKANASVALAEAVMANMKEPSDDAAGTVELLFKHKADPNVRDIEGNTVLMLAIKNGWYCNNIVENIEMLIKKGADIDVQNKNGETALLLAVKTGRMNIVKVILEKENNLDVMKTALDLAIEKNNVFIKILINKRIEQQEKLEIPGEPETSTFAKT